MLRVGFRAELVVVLIVGGFTPAWAQDPSSARLQGWVLSRKETPLAAAEVAIHGTDRAVLTDSAGRFVLSGLSPGQHVIRIRRIGFNAQYLAAKLVAGEEKEVTIVLEPGAYELPEVKVTARATKPIEYAYTTKYDDFFRRQKVGLGHYISRADIEFKRPWRTASLLHALPGVHVRFRHPGMTGTDVWFTGCSKISVWIDGWKQEGRYADVDVAQPSGMEGPTPEYRWGASANRAGMLIDRLFPSQIEMIEVYNSPAEMPAEFLDDSCAAIAIWTR